MAQALIAFPRYHSPLIPSLMGFPFLKLPKLAQLEVLQRSAIIDLITLSYSSQQLKNLVVLANVPVNQFVWFDFLEDDGMTIKTDRKQSIIKIESGDVKSVLLNSRTLFTSRETVQVIEEQLVEHLLTTFRTMDYIQVELGQDDILNNVLFKHRKTIKTLVVRRPRPLTGEEAKFLLEELTVVRWTFIQTPVVDGFQYSEGLRSLCVSVDGPEWLHIDAVLNSSCNIITLHGHRQLFPTDQLNNFLKTWISKEKMEELQTLAIELQSCLVVTDGFWTELLEGVAHERITPGHVTLRRIDGKTADLTINQNLFKFIISE